MPGTPGSARYRSPEHSADRRSPGWIAGKLVKGSGSGIIMNIVIGIIGALTGGFLLSFWFDTAEGGWWFTLFIAILGSVILLWIVGMVQRKT
jgi:uncharacterized membrane protein YeaQ/YmgE (transglycosylase-associated protein family)